MMTHVLLSFLSSDSKTSIARYVLLVALAILCLPAVGFAQDVFWTGASSDSWDDPSNWSPARVPASFDTAIIENGGTATVRTVVSVDNDLDAVDNVRVEDGVMNIAPGGELTVFFNFNAGAFGNTGTVNHTGGILRVADGGDGAFLVGVDDALNAGVGNYNISGDAQVIQEESFDLSYFGRGANSVARVSIADNASMTFANRLEIGAEGSEAEIDQTGGLIQVVPSLPVIGPGDPGINIGNSNGTVTYDISGGELISPNDLLIGVGDSVAVVNQSGGMIVADYSLRTLAQATYNLSGGTLLVNNAALQASNERLANNASDWQVNEIGTGEFGEFNLSGTGQLILHDRSQVGGVMNQTGGELHLVDVPDRAHEADLNIADSTTASYNLSGGLMNVAGGINVGLWNGSDGDFNVTGGNIISGSIGVGAGTDPAGVGPAFNRGTMNMSAGEAQVGNLWVGVGNKSLGTMNLSGGNVEVSGNIEVAPGFAWNTADDGQFLTEGILNLSGDAHLSGSNMLLGGRSNEADPGMGTGTVNQTGGTVELNGGVMEIGSGVDSNGTYNLSGGLLDMGGGDINFGLGDGDFQFTGGTLRDAANVNFSLVNAGGALEPGASAGITNINGDYLVDDPSAALNIEIGGLLQGTEYDLLSADGEVSLAGILNVSLLGGAPPVGDTNGDGMVDIVDLNNVRNNFGGMGLGDTNGDNIVDIVDLNNVRNNFGSEGGGFMPLDGDVFEIITATGGVDGQFDTLNFPGLQVGLAWGINYLPNSVELEVFQDLGAVPEPTSLLLATCGAILFSLTRRRRHKR